MGGNGACWVAETRRKPRRLPWASILSLDGDTQVVEQLDTVEDLAAKLLASGRGAAVDELFLARRDERLSDGVDAPLGVE